MSKDTWKKVLLVVLSSAQLALCIMALVMPDIIVGKISREDAVDFLEGVHDEQETVTRRGLVNSQIGFFESIINKTLDFSNREGMVGIFGFALLSTVSSFLTLLYSIQLLCGCANKCQGFCKCMSKKLNKLIKTNYSTGASSVAAAAMTGFSVADLQGGNLGANFYLQIAGGLFSGGIQFAKNWAGKSNAENNPGEDYGMNQCQNQA